MLHRVAPWTPLPPPRCAEAEAEGGNEGAAAAVPCAQQHQSKFRYCVSMMFYGAPTPFPRRLPLALEQSGLDPGVLALLAAARRQLRSLAFIVHHKECATSMRDAFAEGDEGVERAVGHFEARVSAASALLPLSMRDLVDQFLPLDLPGLLLSLQAA
ncbi:hypothetical protein FOA52_003735 [Chlamydomonas sp. UWO 241]|nr:hypothetical protein FOA52_003735 [Chlamydomonas sp. UWO 241]